MHLNGRKTSVPLDSAYMVPVIPIRFSMPTGLSWLFYIGNGALCGTPRDTEGLLPQSWVGAMLTFCSLQPKMHIDVVERKIWLS